MSTFNDSRTTGLGETQTAPWLSRERLKILALLAVTLIVLYLCYLLARPFLPSLAWALALAVVSTPLLAWITKRISNRALSAGITVAIVALALIGLTYVVGRQLFVEASQAAEYVSSQIESGDWRKSLASEPWIAALVTWLEQNMDIGSMVQRGASSLSNFVSIFVSESVIFFIQLLITFFTLFYFYRDRDKITDTLRSLLPLSQRESSSVFQRITDTIHATVFGTLVVSAVQGTLSGLMFWILGLPGPVLWGFVMGLMNIVPILGPYVIWLPAAIWLALQGAWIKALVLTGWGMIVVGLIDNILYPALVGNRIRLHTLPVFFAILGGLAVFGASGLILGPVILAVADALIHIWKHRTADGRSAESTDGDLVIADGSSATSILPTPPPQSPGE